MIILIIRRCVVWSCFFISSVIVHVLDVWRSGGVTVAPKSLSLSLSDGHTFEEPKKNRPQTTSDPHMCVKSLVSKRIRVLLFRFYELSCSCHSFSCCRGLCRGLWRTIQALLCSRHVDRRTSENDVGELREKEGQRKPTLALLFTLCAIAL